MWLLIMRLFLLFVSWYCTEAITTTANMVPVMGELIFKFVKDVQS